MMKHMLMAACLALPLAAVQAEEKKHSPAQAARQEKMAACNKQAGEKKLGGDERKQFMSQCLSAAGVPAAKGEHKMTQQERMAACNKQAGDKALKGDERKAFMSKCLSG